MKTAIEMDTYAEENGFRYICTKSASPQFLRVEHLLRPDEECEIALAPRSIYVDGTIALAGASALVFTNQRMIYLQEKWLLQKATAPVSIDLNDIGDISIDPKGWTDCKLLIETSKGEIGVVFGKETIDKLALIVQEFLDNRPIESECASVESTLSPIEELKKYKELLDMGIITESEFQSKKAKLLSL